MIFLLDFGLSRYLNPPRCFGSVADLLHSIFEGRLAPLPVIYAFLGNCSQLRIGLRGDSSKPWLELGRVCSFG